MQKSKFKQNPADSAVFVLYEPHFLLESKFREMSWLSVYLCLWYLFTDVVANLFFTFNIFLDWSGIKVNLKKKVSFKEEVRVEFTDVLDQQSGAGSDPAPVPESSPEKVEADIKNLARRGNPSYVRHRTKVKTSLYIKK